MPKTIFALVIVLAFLIAFSAVGAIANPEIYMQETINWKIQALAQDWINLILVAPLIVISAIFAYRNHLVGKLVLVGVLIANLYSFMIYAFFIHFGLMFPLYISVLGLTFYLLLFLLSSLSAAEIMRRFGEGRIRHAASVILIAVGLFFFLAWSGQIYSELTSGPPYLALQETWLFINPVHAIDLAFFLPGLIIVGVFLYRKNPLGYLLAPPLLISLFIISANICSITYLFHRRNIEADAAILPIFAGLGLIQLFTASGFLKQIRSDKSNDNF
jgi:hypothetical protein